MFIKKSLHIWEVACFQKKNNKLKSVIIYTHQQSREKYFMGHIPINTYLTGLITKIISLQSFNSHILLQLTDNANLLETWGCNVISFTADLEWKIIYVGSAESENYDQTLDTVYVGPVPEGKHMFVFQVSVKAHVCACMWWVSSCTLSLVSLLNRMFHTLVTLLYTPFSFLNFGVYCCTEFCST